MRNLLHRLGAKAGIDKRVHPDGLRHTFAWNSSGPGRWSPPSRPCPGTPALPQPPRAHLTKRQGYARFVPQARQRAAGRPAPYACRAGLISLVAISSTNRFRASSIAGRVQVPGHRRQRRGSPQPASAASLGLARRREPVPPRHNRAAAPPALRVKHRPARRPAR